VLGKKKVFAGEKLKKGFSCQKTAANHHLKKGRIKTSQSVEKNRNKIVTLYIAIKLSPLLTQNRNNQRFPLGKNT